MPRKYESREVIERPKHKLSLIAIYRTAFSTVPRCPSIYLATFLFWLLILPVMVGAAVGAGFVVLSSFAFMPLYKTIFGALQFIAGMYFGFALLLASIFGLMVSFMRAGRAGMYLRLHQGMRPGVADFVTGIAKYSWRFLKGYFHLVLIYAIPVFIVLGWIMIRFATYSSLIYESWWNSGLRMDFVQGNRIAGDIARIIMALTFLLLFVWEQPIVLEGATFQQGFLGSIKFTVRNPLRVLAVAIINFIVLGVIFFISMALTYRPYIATNPFETAQHPFIVLSPFLIFIFLDFIFSPIMSYTRFLLYLPNQPFNPLLTRAVIRPQTGLLVNDGRGAAEEQIKAIPDEKAPPPISYYGKDAQQVLFDEDIMHPQDVISEGEKDKSVRPGDELKE